MKPLRSPKTERIQLVVLFLLLSPPSTTHQSGGSSVRTNKQGAESTIHRPSKEETANWSFCTGSSSTLQGAASNCNSSFALRLCVLYPTSRAHRLKNSRLSFYQYPPTLPKHPLPVMACQAGTSQSSPLAAAGSPSGPIRVEMPCSAGL